jgi:hypothetical protein
VQAIFTQAIGLVLAENQRVLQSIAYPAVEQLAQKIIEPIWDLFNQLPIFEASGEQNKD